MADGKLSLPLGMDAVVHIEDFVHSGIGILAPLHSEEVIAPHSAPGVDASLSTELCALTGGTVTLL